MLNLRFHQSRASSEGTVRNERLWYNKTVMGSKIKASAILLLKIFREFSDEDNLITMAEIKDKFKQHYDIEIDRRTVVNSIALLESLGYEISDYCDSKKGYYIISRDFEPSEIRLLMDSVFTNKAISSTHAKDLINKLQKFVSVHKRKNYKSLTLCTTDNKSYLKQTFFNIDILDEAIALGKQVEFVYMQFDLDKKLVAKGDVRVVSPLAIAVYESNYYLIADTEGGMRHFHIFKIREVKVRDSSVKDISTKDSNAKDISAKEIGASKKVAKQNKTQQPQLNFNLQEYVSQAVFMYGGAVEKIVLKCNNKILDYVISKFGSSAQITKFDDSSFLLKIEAAPRGVLIWALKMLDTVEVLEPLTLRNEIINIIANSPYNL